MKKLTQFSLLIALFLFTQLSFSQNYTGNKSDIDEILKKVTLFSKHYVTGNHEEIANLYTKGAKLLPGGSEILHGRNNISNFWKRPKSVKIFSHKITPEEIKVLGDYAYDYGYYEGVSLNNSTNKKEHWKGKYTIIWKKVNSTWLMDVDIWNSVQTNNENQ